MSRWSPISSVPSMEAEGITRACTIVPVIRKNASATQTQESSSRTRWSRSVGDLVLPGALVDAAVPEAGSTDSAAGLLIGPMPLGPSLMVLSFRSSLLGWGTRIQGRERQPEQLLQAA